MSHIFTPIARDFNSLRTLFFVVLMLLVASFGTVVRASADDPKPYSKCWAIDTPPDILAGGASDKTNVYFFAADGALEAVDQRTGARSWSTDLGGSVVSNLLITDTAAIFATAGQPQNGKATLRAVSKQTGITIWSAAVQASGPITLGMVGDKIAAINPDGQVSAYAISSGSFLWSQSVGARIIAAPLITAANVILGTDANDLISVDMARGVTAKKLRMTRPPTAFFVDDEGRTLVGDGRGNLAFTAVDGDRIWSFKNGAQISYLLPYDSEFLATSFDNFIYKFSRSGGIEWKRRLSGRLSMRPLVIDNDGVLSITGDPSIYVIDLTNGKIINRIEIGGDENSSPRVAAAGPGGFAVVTPQGVQFFSREACPQK